MNFLFVTDKVCWLAKQAQLTSLQYPMRTNIIRINHSHPRSYWNCHRGHLHRTHIHRRHPLLRQLFSLFRLAKLPPARQGDCVERTRNAGKFMEWNTENNGARNANGRKLVVDLVIEEGPLINPRTLNVKWPFHRSHSWSTMLFLDFYQAIGCRIS